MAEKLLINVAHEETRVALVESGRLANFEIITSLADNNKGSIFKGIVHRVNASLQAAFVDYGAEKQGFLPLAEVHQRYYPKNFDKNSNRRATIMDVLKQGQEVMVQVVKDEIGQKGATLTTYISLAGRSLAIEADSEKAGISRRVSQDERNRLRKVMKDLDVPDGFGAIMRTAAADQDDDDIHSNQNYLMMQWNNVQERFKSQKHPGLIHQELPLPLRFIRDSLSNSVDEILVDDKKTYEEVRNFCVGVAPELVPRVKLYDDPRPLFFRFQVEEQIDDIFARKIDLPSGGSIVIDQAEALVAIDVNSGRVKTDDIEDTATKTNLEAAAEIARQLKIRDRGGLIVVDFIDMRDKENVRKVEETIRQAFSTDKAKVKFSRISEFGLMEISRQRLQSSVMRGSFTNCHTCGGTGQIRSVESSSLFILRRLKEILIRGNYERVEARMPVGIANYLLNRKRQDLVALERQTGSSIEVMAEEHCPAMKAFFELTTKATSSQRKARRVLQEIDLVRSEVDKRDLEDGEIVAVEKEGVKEAEPSVFAAGRDKLDEQNRILEEGIARKREIEIAQKEADEGLRRQEELRLDKERLEAETEKIRAQDAARRASLGLWGRVKAFFGGLPPMEPSSGDDAPARPKRKKREEEPRRVEARRDRDDRKRPERSEDKERSAPSEKSERPEKPERSERRSRDRDGADRNSRARYPARVEGAGELVEAGGAVVQSAVTGGSVSTSASEAAKKKRRRRRGGRGREEGDGQVEGGSEDGNDNDDNSAMSTDSAETSNDNETGDSEGSQPAREGRGRGRDRDGRGRGRDGRGRGRREDGANAKTEGDDSAAPAPVEEAPAAPAPVVAAPQTGSAPRPGKAGGVVDLRQDRSRPVEAPRAPAPTPAPAPAPAAQTEGSKPNLPRFGGVIDLRGGGAPASTRPAAPARPTAAAPVEAEAKEATPVVEAPKTEAVAAPAAPAPVVEAKKEETKVEAAPVVAAAVEAETEVIDETVDESEIVDDAVADGEGDESEDEAATPEKKRRPSRARRSPKAAAPAAEGEGTTGGKGDA